MRIRTTTVLLAAAALLAGCGGGAKTHGEAGKPPTQVLADAKKAATGASAVHVFGKIVSGGTPLTLDLRIVKDKGGKGAMTENGLRFDIVRIGDKAYIRGSDAFYRKFAGAAAAQLLHGKWLVGSAASGNLAPLVSLTDIGKLFGGVTSTHGILHNAGETTFRDHKVVAIRDMTKGGTLYVAAAGTPYPVAIEGEHGSGTVEFDGWNQAVPISAPQGAVDIGRLGTG